MPKSGDKLQDMLASVEGQRRAALSELRQFQIAGLVDAAGVHLIESTAACYVGWDAVDYLQSALGYLRKHAAPGQIQAPDTHKCSNQAPGNANPVDRTGPTQTTLDQAQPKQHKRR